MASISEAWAMAVGHHQAGRLQAAEQTCRQILAVAPNHAAAWDLLGVINCQCGNNQVALDCIGRAIELDASVADFHCNLGKVYQTLGRLDDAVTCYHRALQRLPVHADAHYNLGTALQAQGNREEGVKWYRRTLELEPNHAEANNNLGNELWEQGKRDEAVACYRRVIGLRPDFAGGYFRLAVALQEQGKRDEAVGYYRRALELEPNKADAYFNLGIILRVLGRGNEAIVCWRRALELKPDIAEAHYNLGSALQEVGKPDDAVACYVRAIELEPNFAEAHNNLGTVAHEQGKWEVAIEFYRRATQLKPDYAFAHFNLGNALQEQGKRAEAVTCYRRTLELKPDLADAYDSLGTALQKLGMWDGAVASHRRAVELKPEFSDAHMNLGNVLQMQGRREEAVACYLRALELNRDSLLAICALVHQFQHLCHWNDLMAFSQRVVEEVGNDSKSATFPPVSPFLFLALPTIASADQQLRCARRWVDGHLILTVAQGRFAHDRSSRCKSKLVVGYLSSDFHSHAVAMLTAELFEKHDRDRFAIYGYSYGPEDDSPMRRRLANAFDLFVDVRSTSYLESAQRIAADEVDILVDLNGYTLNARTQIMALRPAPIQVNYLGYPGTMGASFMDYILVDDFVVPPEQQPFFTEKLVHLPGCYQVNDSQREIAPYTPSRAECGVPEEGFVFCCFNSSYKIAPDVFDAWMNLLVAIPGSVLWLLESNQIASANLRNEAHARGVAAERLVFAPRVDMAGHLARHRLADLFLDTFPYNAHTTASEALWAGCPVLTISGQTFASRVAGSLLRSLGLPELITTSLPEYEALALRLARDSGQLADLRARLQANRTSSGLFDATRFARTLEKAYLTMWDTYISGEQPRSFRVNPT